MRLRDFRNFFTVSGLNYATLDEAESIATFSTVPSKGKLSYDLDLPHFINRSFSSEFRRKGAESLKIEFRN